MAHWSAWGAHIWYMCLITTIVVIEFCFELNESAAFFIFCPHLSFSFVQREARLPLTSVYFHQKHKLFRPKRPHCEPSSPSTEHVSILGEKFQYVITGSGCVFRLTCGSICRVFLSSMDMQDIWSCTTELADSVTVKLNCNLMNL